MAAHSCRIHTYFCNCLHLSKTCLPVLFIWCLLDISLHTAKPGGCFLNGHSLSRAMVCSLDHFLR